MTISVGSASIFMRKNGELNIKGFNINIEGRGKVAVSGQSDCIVKGSRIS